MSKELSAKVVALMQHATPMIDLLDYFSQFPVDQVKDDCRRKIREALGNLAGEASGAAFAWGEANVRDGWNEAMNLVAGGREAGAA